MRLISRRRTGYVRYAMLRMDHGWTAARTVLELPPCRYRRSFDESGSYDSLERRRCCAKLARGAPAQRCRYGKTGKGEAGVEIRRDACSHDSNKEVGKCLRSGSSMEWSPESFPRLQRISGVSVASLLVEGIRRSARALCNPRGCRPPVSWNRADDDCSGEGAVSPSQEASSLYRKHKSCIRLLRFHNRSRCSRGAGRAPGGDMHLLTSILSDRPIPLPESFSEPSPNPGIFQEPQRKNFG